MGTFLQWLSKKPLRPVTWACGPETVLAQEIIREYRTAHSGVPFVVIDASAASQREVWDTLLSQPAGGSVTVVYSAEKAVLASELKVLLGEATPFSPVIFVTAVPTYARGESEHLELIAASRNGQVVRCVPPSKEEDMVRIVSSWWPGAGDNAAAEVLERCGGSLELAREACDKAVLAGIPVSLLSAVCRRAPGSDYADFLVSGDRKKAATAAGGVPQEEVGRTIGLLASRLSLLGLLNSAKRQGMTPQEQVIKLRADPYVLRLLRPYAPDYPASRENSCREVLAMAESAHRSGVSGGVLEAVAALW